MPTPLDQELYNKVKEHANKIYDRPSAYKSGYIVKKYKELGGEYADDNKPKNLKRWFKEEWKDIGNMDYPVYRPTKRINKDTPLTFGEIDKKHAINQILLKQVFKDKYNLPPFKEGGSTEELIEAVKAPYSHPIWKVSNPIKAQKLAFKYLNKNAILYLSNRKDKKYMVLDPEGKGVHFGNINYEDFTKHENMLRRKNYLRRATNIKGDWRETKYSPNNLAIHILW